MGIKTVAIYTEDEKNALHVLKADESVSLGEGTIQETYLNKAKIISPLRKRRQTLFIRAMGSYLKMPSSVSSSKKKALLLLDLTPYHMNLMGDKMASKKKVMEIGARPFLGITGRCKILVPLRNKQRSSAYLFLLRRQRWWWR